MTRAEDRRAERQAAKDRALLVSYPAVIDAESGRVNIWACPVCGLPTVARDVHVGVTPFMLGCRANPGHFEDDGSEKDGVLPCRGTARSTMYVLPSDPPDWVARLLVDPPWEWYRPTALAELRSMDNVLAEHVRRGGLVLRKGANPRSALEEALGSDPATQADMPKWRRMLANLARSQQT